jgi:pre-mRNA-splicing factor ATP-dependent RNA helicase DHX15/PRP43
MTSHKNIGILDPEGKYPNPLTNEPYSDDYKKLAAIWSTYPAYEKRNEILKIINDNQLIFVISGTGSGKTVLIPKYALHNTNYQGKVAITLPKRVVTSAAATFAAKTLDVPLGKDIGYQYKGSPKEMINDNNKMIYMTDGSLIMKIVRDPLLSEFKVVIIDEAHERKVQIDLLLLFLRKILESGKRPDLKVIIMSATIDGPKYQNYFSKIKSQIINISGQPNHPIDVRFSNKFVDNYIKEGSRILSGIVSLEPREDVLFFITTSNEALQICRGIRKEHSDVYCIEVYADMDKNLKIYAETKDEFKKLGDFKQKLVIATNVAESSLTIDGLKYVIDSGYELYSYFDPFTNANILEKRLITKAQALQRRGRVGRTEPGICYHLMTSQQFELLEKYPEPDILKQDITTDLIKIIMLTDDKALNSGIKYMNELMDNPKKEYTDLAIDLYNKYNLIDDSGHLTAMGHHISHFSSLSLNQTLFLMYSFQMHCAREACNIIAMIETFSGKFMNIFYKSDNNRQGMLGGASHRDDDNPRQGMLREASHRDEDNNRQGMLGGASYHTSNCSDKTACVDKSSHEKELKKLLSNSLVKKSDHFAFLHVFNLFKENTDRKTWAKKLNIKYEAFMSAKRLSEQHFHKLINISKAPQLERAKNMNSDHRILECLKLSHRHKTAKNMKALYPIKKIDGSIQKDSVVNVAFKKNSLNNKTFIYDELMCINGSWEYGIITII